MSKKVLVAFASKYGATEEIAETVCTTLRQAGFNTDLLPADQVEELRDYQAVVLGSAVYAGNWRKEAVEFLKRNEYTLADLPVWFFSSGPTGEGDPVELMKGWHFPAAQQPLADHIKPRDTAFFHGVLNLKKLGFAERMMVRGLRTPVGDFRDWDAIKAWAMSIAETLKQEIEQKHPTLHAPR